MKDIEITTIKHEIRTCNSCGARNYTPTALPNDGKRKVDILYELRISRMCIALCEDCLKEVADRANHALKYGAK